MNAVSNRANRFSPDLPAPLNHPQEETRRHRRLLKVARQRSSRKSPATPVIQQSRKKKRGKTLAAKAVSKSLLEIAPTAALCLLLLDE